MKGIIIAGGRGTRLYPMTKATNKHLLPVGREPMIYHAVHRLEEAGIKEILVVTSTEHMGDIVRCLGSGTDLGVDFTYKVQEKPLGIAHALSLAENFAGEEKICVMLGDNIFAGSIAYIVENYRHQEKGARVVLRKVGDPERFGVAALDEKQVIEIEEKPAHPKSDYAVIGLYFYDSKVFDIIRGLDYSARGELEITSVNNAYIQRGELEYDIFEGAWMDTGTPESLFEANRLFLENVVTKETFNVE